MTERSQKKVVVKVVTSAAGMALVGMVMVASFAGALHRPTPHNLPVAIVGPAAVVSQVEDGVSVHAPGAFHLTGYGSRSAAHEAVLNRSVDAALVLIPGRPVLLVAGAAGKLVSEIVTSAFRALAAASGQHLVVRDLRPLPSGDPAGISQLFLTLGLALSSIGFALSLILFGGRELKAVAQLGLLVMFSILAALLAVWVVDGIFGALVGSPLALFGVSVLTCFAIATACTAGARLVGLPIFGLLALLIVAIGVPAGGGPFGTTFVTSWYGDLGSALPAGASMSAIRNVVYFDGHALGAPLLVLGLWSVIAACSLFAPPLRAIMGRRQSLDRNAAVGNAA